MDATEIRIDELAYQAAQTACHASGVELAHFCRENEKLPYRLYAFAVRAEGGLRAGTIRPTNRWAWDDEFRAAIKEAA